MKKMLSILIVLLMLPVMVNADEIVFNPISTFGGDGYDYINDGEKTSDGGFIAVGNLLSDYIDGNPVPGGSDAVIMKFDKLGEIEWYKYWGGSSSEEFTNIDVLEDGSYIVAGFTDSNDIEGIAYDNDQDLMSEAVLVKFDKSGNITWQKRWGGNGSDHFEGLTTTNDGGYIVTGYTDSTNISGIQIKDWSTSIVVKYDSNGNVEWQKGIAPSGTEALESIVQLDDGTYVVSGMTNGDENHVVTGGAYHTFVAKLSTTGKIVWEFYYSGNNYDHPHNMIKTSDNGIVIVGMTSSTDLPEHHGSEDGFIIKVSSSGKLVWEKLWGGSSRDDFRNVLETEKGDLVAVGIAASKNLENIYINGVYDAALVQFDANGNLISQASYGGSDTDEFQFVREFSTDNYAIIGSSRSIDLEGLENNGDNDIIILTTYLKPSDLAASGGSEVTIYDFDISNEDGNGYAKIERDGNKVYLTIVPYDGYKLKSITGDYGFNERNNFTRLPDGRYYLELTEDLVLTVKFERDYKITLNPLEHGEATAEQYDKTIGRISATPDEGYELDSIVIKDTTDKEIVYTQKEDGYYYFDLNDDVEITVTFKEIPKEVVKGDEEENTDTTTTTTNKVEEEEKVENPKTADAFIYYACAVVCSLFGIWSVEQYRKTVKE